MSNDHFTGAISYAVARIRQEKKKNVSINVPTCMPNLSKEYCYERYLCLLLRNALSDYMYCDREKVSVCYNKNGFGLRENQIYALQLSD